MNQRDILEIRRRLNPEKRYPSLICGCYYGCDGHVVTSFASTPERFNQEDMDKLMGLFKRTLSGTPEQNLLSVDLPMPGGRPGEHQLAMMDLCASALRDEDLVGEFFGRMGEHIRRMHNERKQSVEEDQLLNNYLVLLLHDGYDVPRRKDDELVREESDSVLNYVLCAVCPVKQSKPVFQYVAAQGEFHCCGDDWVVGAPDCGFMYPAFEERGANVNRAVFYTRDANDLHDELVETLFGTQLTMSSGEQKETFQAILAETLKEECSLATMQQMHETVSDMIRVQKEDKDAEPLTFTGDALKQVLTDCGVSQEKSDAFADRYTEVFGDKAEVPAANLVTPKQFKVETPSVSIKVDPDHSDLVETRMIDGRRYILVLVDGDVELNGMRVTQ